MIYVFGRIVEEEASFQLTLFFLPLFAEMLCSIPDEATDDMQEGTFGVWATYILCALGKTCHLILGTTACHLNMP